MRETELNLNTEEKKRIDSIVQLILNLNRDNQIRSEAYIAGLTASQESRVDQPMAMDKI